MCLAQPSNKDCLEKNIKQGSSIREFLSNFKTKLCLSMEQHQQELCFFYHSEKDYRRNPYTIHKFTYYPKNICNCTSPKCECIHNIYEKNYHPLLYKTQTCQHFYKCLKGLLCSWSHEEEFSMLQKQSFFRFDITLFKTEQCYRKEPHERKTCLYFHNERDRRRATCMIQYSHIPCQKQCNIKSCGFSHNKIEQLYHPSRYKSKFCQTYPNKISICQYKQFCSFAHTQEEIIIEILSTENKDTDYLINHYKTVWCPYTLNHDRSTCPYAHNYQDFRRKPKEFKYLPQKCQNWIFSEEIKSIEESGCKSGMKCKKCHGWMELRYHPEVYKKNQRFIIKKEEEMQANQKKIINLKDNKSNSKQKKIPSTIQKQTHNEEPNKNNIHFHTVGAPFFKNERQIPESKVEKSQQNDEVEENNEIKMKISQANTLIKSSNRNRLNIEIDDKNKNISLMVFEEDHKLWGKYSPLNNQDEGKSSCRSKSEGNSDQYDIHYSNSIQDVIADQALLMKLTQRKINQIRLINLDQNKIQAFKEFNAQERTTLIRKLKQYSLKREILPIEYSKEITKFFIKKNGSAILQKMRLKKVKEGKLVALASKEIKELSFLMQNQKVLLPKILKQFKSDLQFAELNKEMSKVIEQTDQGS